MYSFKQPIRPLFLILSLFILSTDASAQYFKNHQMQVPILAWVGMDSSLRGINKRPSGANDVGMVGIGYAYAIDYKFWWTTETTIGFTQGFRGTEFQNILLMPLRTATGFRYNFSDQAWRPFVSLNAEFMYFFHKKLPKDKLFGAWFGARAGGGLEVFVGDDIAVQIEGGYLFLVNFDQGIRNSALAKLGLNFYF